MGLPNFLIVGTQKAATTSLHHILKQHPDVYLPVIKEVHFFDDDENFKKGIDWYARHFLDSGQAKAIGDITPSYMFFEKVPERIFQTLGTAVKLIFVLRQPAERAWSQYLHIIRTGAVKNISFEKIIEMEMRAIYGKADLPIAHYSFIRRGLYSIQIKRFLQLFPLENMLFILFEDDFIKNRKNTISHLLDFIGVSQCDINLNVKKNIATVPKFKKLNEILFGDNMLSRLTPNRLKYFIKNINRSNKKPPVISDEIKKKVTAEYFHEDIIALEKLIHRNLQSWY